MICIWIIVLSFAITLCILCICTIHITLVSWDKPLELQSGLAQLGLSVCSPLYIISLGKLVRRTRSSTTHKLKLELSIEYFILFFSYKYFLPAWFYFTSEAWDLTQCLHKNKFHNHFSPNLYVSPLHLCITSASDTLLDTNVIHGQSM